VLPENADLAIYWPRRRKIDAVSRSGRCPSYWVPRHLRPGGRVALVDEHGSVRLVFRMARIDEGLRIRAADGKQYDGRNVIVAERGSVRSPGKRDPRQLPVNHNAAGAFLYLDPITHIPIPVGEPRLREAGPEPEGTESNQFPPRLYPLFANNVGKTLSQPERSLIRAYTSWVGDDSMFGHHKALKTTGLYTDLFMPCCWTLFEAKASTKRRILREAIGQLYDYQRHYTRSPRLAVLLPLRPSSTLMELFQKRRIIVVWQSRGASFSDSSPDGALTKDLRNKARSRVADKQA
jgi:hypothetical protein